MTQLKDKGKVSKDKKYTVLVNCPCFQNIEVVAKDETEAEEIATLKFQCPANDYEVGEVTEGHIFGDKIYTRND